jgi:hypothetical protein
MSTRSGAEMGVGALENGVAGEQYSGVASGASCGKPEDPVAGGGDDAA